MDINKICSICPSVGIVNYAKFYVEMVSLFIKYVASVVCYLYVVSGYKYGAGHPLQRQGEEADETDEVR